MFPRWFKYGALAAVLLAPAALADDPPHKTLYKQAQEVEQSGDVAKALEMYERAAGMSRQAAPADAAAILYWIGGIHQKQLRYGAAKQAYEESLQLREKALGKDASAVAVSLNALGNVSFTLGDYASAEPLFQRALAIEEKASGADSAKTAIMVNNLAELYRTTGDYKRAEPLFQRALQIDEKASGPEHTRVAIRLSNLAELYRQTGNYARAEELLKRALEIDDKAFKIKENSALNLGIRFNNLGQLYRTLGDFARAEPFYKKALELWENSPGIQSPVVAAGLNNYAWILQAQGRLPEAEALYKKASDIVEKAVGAEHPDLARNLNNLALLYAEQGNIKAAEPLYQRAQAIWEKAYGTQHPSVAAVLHNQAKLARARQDFPRAESLLQKALTIAQSSGEAELLWAVQDNLSQLLRQQEQFAAAILMGKEAVNHLQKLRLGIASMDKELQRSFIQEKSGVYQRLADLLLAQGRVAEAQQVLQMLKEEEYFDFVRRDEEQAEQVKVTEVSFTPEEKPLAQKAASFYQRVGGLGERFKKVKMTLAMKNQPAAAANPEIQQEIAKEAEFYNQYFGEMKQSMANIEENQAAERMAQSKDESVVALSKEYLGLLQKVRANQTLTPQEQGRKNELQRVMTKARSTFNACIQESKGHALGHELELLKGIKGTLEELGHGAVLLNYLITPEKVRIILTTPEVQLCRETAIKEAELDDKINQFREALKARPHPVAALRTRQNQAVMSQSQGLYKLLLEPVAKDLQAAQAKTVMLALDGRLRYIPFSALHDGEQFLIQRYALALFTDAARDKLKDKPKAEWKVAGLGLTQGVREFNPLPAVAEELDNILKVLPGQKKLNQEFNLAGLMDSLELRYPVLHIASHFVFEPSTDKDSYLLLGDGNVLDLAQIRSEFDFNGIDLLTLSACQTGVGTVGKGQEVEGFGALAQKEGAKSVMATLWPVDDRSTGQFMRHFYQLHGSQPDMTKAEAMQQAQASFIQAKQAAVTPPGAEQPYPADYGAPYYWAPFILMGNWL